MVQKLLLYLDDSGTRHPDHAGAKSAQGYDWFALGGVLVLQEDEERCRELRDEFCSKWKISHPLHSVRIRSRQGNFAWLGTLAPETFIQFMEDLTRMLYAVPLVGTACVIDRPGYNARYKEKYGSERWHLCKTAFTVVVERAAKYAQSLNRKLDVMVEKTNKDVDRNTKSYFENMKIEGNPFDAETSAKYGPMSGESLANTLYDFKTKDKESPMIQLADLYLYPICRGGYEPLYRPYQGLRDHKKLRDDYLEPAQLDVLGIKYSCFELVHSADKKV